MAREKTYNFAIKCPKNCYPLHQFYDADWDRYFCKKCDEWLEKGCAATTIEECPFKCWECPERPSQVKKTKENSKC